MNTTTVTLEAPGPSAVFIGEVFPREIEQRRLSVRRQWDRQETSRRAKLAEARYAELLNLLTADSCSAQSA